MKFNLPAFGSALLAAGPLMMNLSPSKAAWWTGFAFLVLGPLLMGIHGKGK